MKVYDCTMWKCLSWTADLEVRRKRVEILRSDVIASVAPVAGEKPEVL